MNVWLLAACCGIGGSIVGVALDISTALIKWHVPPWKRKAGRLPELGWYYVLLVVTNIVLAAAAAAVVYGQHQVASLSFKEISLLASAGLSATTVLQRFGGAIRK